MNEYIVTFEFSTFRNSSITARQGSIHLITELSAEEIWQDEEGIKQICLSEVKRLKPKWNVFTLNLKTITLDEKKKPRNKRRSL